MEKDSKKLNTEAEKGKKESPKSPNLNTNNTNSEESTDPTKEVEEKEINGEAVAKEEAHKEDDETGSSSS